jgi:hypothetical protein
MCVQLLSFFLLGYQIDPTYFLQNVEKLTELLKTAIAATEVLKQCPADFKT